MNNKGFEFSVNLLVSMMIFLIVLIAAIMLFVNSGKEGARDISCQQDFQIACNNYLAAGGCSDDSIIITNHISPEIMLCGIGSQDSERARQACCLG